MSLEARLQTITSAYQKLQLSLSTSIEAHQRLEAQQQETNTVKLEFKSLKPENVVYKLIGPVLIQQDQGEAKANVEKRLEFISNELWVSFLLVCCPGSQYIFSITFKWLYARIYIRFPDSSHYFQKKGRCPN